MTRLHPYSHPFHVTIKDISTWTTTIQANDSTHAEHLALDLFLMATDRSEYFQEASDTTMEVEEVVA